VLTILAFQMPYESCQHLRDLNVTFRTPVAVPHLRMLSSNGNGQVRLCLLGGSSSDVQMVREVPVGFLLESFRDERRNA